MFNRWLLLGFLCNTVVDLYNTSLFHEIFDCSLEYYNNSDNKFSNNFTIYWTICIARKQELSPIYHNLNLHTNDLDICRKPKEDIELLPLVTGVDVKIVAAPAIVYQTPGVTDCSISKVCILSMI